MAIEYKKLMPQNFLCTTPVGKLAGETVLLWWPIVGGLMMGLNSFLPGPKSAGKSQIMRDYRGGLFHGDRHSLWETGRTDYKPKDLFESLNISLVNEDVGAVPEIKAVYSQRQVHYLVRSYKEINGDYELTWKKITKAERNNLIEENSITTDQLLLLRNIDKKFFCIDEFNRCPPVIMNLFYGLMTGEIEHNGKTIKLGNGYHVGIAAANPISYSGTFDMDFAMWARFHIVVDFGAYSPSRADKDELVQRNLAPDLQKSELEDHVEELEEIKKEIEQKEVTLDERVVLQYLQTGLNTCHKEEKEKNKNRWPRKCDELNCEDKSKLCGQLCGIDVRAIRAVYRLAKGLEKIVELKSGHKQFDPAESLILAYKFVAPYKGCVNPRISKEHNGIEGLVLESCEKTLRQNLQKKLKAIKKVAKKEAVKISTYRTLTALKKVFAKKKIKDRFDEVEQEITKKYEVREKLTIEQVMQKHPELFAQAKKNCLKEEFIARYKEYESQIILAVAEADTLLRTQYHAGLKKLKQAVQSITAKYEKASVEEQEKLEPVKQKLEKEFECALKSMADIIFDTELIFDELPKEAYDKADQQARVKLPEEEIIYIPNNKKKAMKAELIETLNKALKEKEMKTFESEKKKLFEKEWEFLQDFYPEYLEQARKEVER